MKAADPSWIRTLLFYLAPLSLFPGLAWPLGRAARGELPWTAGALALSFASSALSAVASILALAAAFYTLAPAFGMPRAWGRCVAVAAFASTPVLLTGALLVFPVMVVVSVAALVHCFALCYFGVQQVLGCRESDAAFFVAAAGMACLVGSLAVGGLCGAAGLL